MKFQKCQGRSLLHYTLLQTGHLEHFDSHIFAAVEVIKTLYDAHPEAIEGIGIEQNRLRYHLLAVLFLSGEMFYARQAKDHHLITTPDDSGRLPLHTALQDNVRLGSIKLL